MILAISLYFLIRVFLQRATAPVPDLKEITYITDLSVIANDPEGVKHSIVISVKEPHRLDSACPVGVSPCLADGVLRVTLDGEDALLGPGTITLAAGVTVSAVSLPGACRSFEFELYWQEKKLELTQAGRRRLGASPRMGERVLADQR